MVVGAHQPNYMPWVGYFYKMIHCDKFILADDVQYTTHSYINRVRIKTFQGKQWLTVPVITRGKGLQKIRDIKIARSQNWQHKHWQTIYLNYKYAPFFEQYADYLKKIYQKEWIYLVDLNIELINFFKKALDSTCSLSRSSDYLAPDSPTKRIVEMVKKSGGTAYISGESGKKYLEEIYFVRNGINLKYAKYKPTPYRQQFDDFLANLSIIDLLFNEGTKSMLYLRNSGKIVSSD
jgi:hypothetical protein